MEFYRHFRWEYSRLHPHSAVRGPRPSHQPVLRGDGRRGEAHISLSDGAVLPPPESRDPVGNRARLTGRHLPDLGVLVSGTRAA